MEKIQSEGHSRQTKPAVDLLYSVSLRYPNRLIPTNGRFFGVI